MTRSVRRTHSSSALLVAAFLVVWSAPGAAYIARGAADTKPAKNQNAAKAMDKRSSEQTPSPARPTEGDNPRATPPAGSGATGIPDPPPQSDQPENREQRATPPPASAERGAETTRSDDSSWFGFSTMTLVAVVVVGMIVLGGIGLAIRRMLTPRHTLQPAPPYGDSRTGHTSRRVDEPRPMSPGPFDSPSPARPSGTRPEGDPKMSDLLAEIRELARKNDSIQGEMQSTLRAISLELAGITRWLSADDGSRSQEFVFDTSHGNLRAPAAPKPAIAPTAPATAGTLPFPVLASECHRAIKQNRLTTFYAAKGIVPGSLKQSPAEASAAFVIVPCGSSPNDFYAIPRTPRLSE